MVNSNNNSTFRKRVSFASCSQLATPARIIVDPACDQQQPLEKRVATHSCHYYCDGLDKEERKTLCWYSPEDLRPCREEAKDSIQQLQTSLEQGTLDSLSEDICLRGIEKYADAAGKYRKQRIYIESILQQQRAIVKEQRLDASENLANLSRYLSRATTELALFYAARCAAELSLLRHEEEDEEEADDWEDEEESLCSSQIDVHESKASPPTVEVCVEPSLTSSKRKRSRCHAFGEMNIPPRKIQCCE